MAYAIHSHMRKGFSPGQVYVRGFNTTPLEHWGHLHAACITWQRYVKWKDMVQDNTISLTEHVDNHLNAPNNEIRRISRLIRIFNKS